MSWHEAMAQFNAEFEAAEERFKKSNYQAWLVMECVATAVKALTICTFVVFWTCLLMGRIH